MSFEGVWKVYRDGTRAVRDFSLEVGDGELMVFVGPSGCGKTTALRMVAGLEDISEGEIRIGGAVVNGLHPRKRDVAMVFQNYALYPHLTVFKNIAFGLKVRGMPREEIRRRVLETAQTLGLRDELGRKPAQLSGGQRQRVAMGRAIVREPQAFLMDEPLSNLDAKLRVQMRAEIARIQHQLGATTIYVTHDQVEAMTMGDRVAVLRKGRLQQVDAPQRLYERPVNLFVASFIGSPEMNLLQATLERQNGRLLCRFGEQSLTLPNEVARERPWLERYLGQPIAVGIRPEHLEDAAVSAGAPPERLLRGRVVATELLGSELLAHVELPARRVVTREVLEVAVDVDKAVAEHLQAEAKEQRTVAIGRFSPDSKVQSGDVVEIAATTEKLHFFDLETETAIDADPGPSAVSDATAVA